MNAKSEKSKLSVRVVDRRNPLSCLSNEERALAKSLGLAGNEKPARYRKQLPPRWREIVFAICSRPFAYGTLANALGISRRALFYRLKDPKDPISDAIEAARGVMFSVIVDPLYDRLLKDRSAEADDLRKWFAQRIFGDQFNVNAQPNQPQVQVNAQVNVGQLPRAMTPAEYAKLFADPKVIDAKSDQVPAGDARNA